MIFRNGTKKHRIGRWLVLLAMIAVFAVTALAGPEMSSAAAKTSASLTVGRSSAPKELVKKKKKNKNKNSGSSNSSNNSNSNSSNDSSGDSGSEKTSDGDSLDTIEVEKDGTYTSKMEVAAYIHQYGELPSNYITKNEAKDLGWVSSWGNLDEVAPGKSIGGDRFGNYEGLLPEKNGRKYYECDIDFEGGTRNAKRIIFSNDGFIFYTEDHYESFEQLWPEE